MLISRRDALAGTAAVASMLAVPPSKARPASQVVPNGSITGAQTTLPKYILDQDLLIYPPLAFVNIYGNDFSDNCIHYDRRSVPRNHLVGVYESYGYCTPFAQGNLWNVFEASRSSYFPDENYREIFAELFNDGRSSFFIADHSACRLGVPHYQRVLFERNSGWLSFRFFSRLGQPSHRNMLGIFQVKRGDHVEV